MMLKYKESALKPFSMKKKIIINTLIGSLALFLTIGLLGSFYLIKWLNRGFDENISSKSRVLVTQVKATSEGIEFDFADEFMPEFSRKQKPEYFQLWINNNVIEKSNSLRLIFKDTELPVTDFKSKQEIFKNIILPDGRNGRMLRISFYPQIPDQDNRTEPIIDQLQLVTLAVARERESLDKTIRDFLLIFIGIVIIFTFITAFTIWQIVSRGLMPLKNMQRKMSVLAADNLSERLVVQNTPKELEETVNQFNLMINRLEASFEREKRFTSEVAHELGTSILEMRKLAEAAITGEQGPSPYNDILETSILMQNTVSNLMALARCDKGNIILEPQIIKLADRLNTCWHRYADIAQRHSIQHENTIDHAFKIMSSLVELDIIFNNLISNAISYSIEGTTVTSSCKTENNILCICITNQPKDLSREDLKKMFDRMWQKSISHTAHGHAGLGLALVKSYSEILGLKIEIELCEQGLLTIKLCGFYQDH